MTAIPTNSIRADTAAKHPPRTRRARRARRARIGASHEFRSLVAEFEARRPAGREPPAEPAEAPIRPRHVIAAESILARLRETATPGDPGGRARARHSGANRVGPVHALRTAKRIVLAGLDRVDHRLQRTLRRHGFDRAEVAAMADTVMSGMAHRAEVALNHLPLAPRPIEAAKHLFASALDRIADNLSGALRRHGMGRDRIAEICHVAMNGIDDRVETALDGLAESWSRTRGVVAAT